MNKSFLIFSMIATLIFISCKNEQKVSKDFVKTFEGKIDTSQILMKITCDSGKIVGSYYNNFNRIEYSLKGV